MPGEVTVEVGPNDIILRESTIYHASHANSTTDGRLMQHWCASTLRFCSCALKVKLMTVLEYFGRLFRAADHSPNNHRMRWDDCLSSAFKNASSRFSELRCGSGVTMTSTHDMKRSRLEKETQVCWGTLDGRCQPSCSLEGGNLFGVFILRKTKAFERCPYMNHGLHHRHVGCILIENVYTTDSNVSVTCAEGTSAHPSRHLFSSGCVSVSF